MTRVAAIERIDVISLDRTPERLALFRSNNPNLPIERFTAVDGQLLDRWDCVDQGLITAGNPYTLGQLGAAVSHIRLWQRCAAGTRALHIAEDDAILRRDFCIRAEALLNSIGQWDIVLWGWNFDWPIEIAMAPGLGSTVVTCDEPGLRKEWRSFAASETNPALLRVLRHVGSCAYSISPAGARRFLKACLPIGGKATTYPGKIDVPWHNRTLDVEMARHYPSMSSFISVAPLAITLNDKSASTI